MKVKELKKMLQRFEDEDELYVYHDGIWSPTTESHDENTEEIKTLMKEQSINAMILGTFKTPTIQGENHG